MTELLKDVEAERQQHEATQPDTPWQEPQLGIFVVHNKQVKKKLAQLPEDIMQHRCVLFARPSSVLAVGGKHTHPMFGNRGHPGIDCANSRRTTHGAPALVN